MQTLTRDQILMAADYSKEYVECPEWGGGVFVRGLTGSERDRFEQATLKRDKAGTLQVDMTNMRARMAALCMVDDAGNRIFTDSDVIALGKKSAIALDRIVKVAQRLSGMKDGADDEAAEDFFDAQNDDSTID